MGAARPLAECTKAGHKNEIWPKNIMGTQTPARCDGRGSPERSASWHAAMNLTRDSWMTGRMNICNEAKIIAHRHGVAAAFSGKFDWRMSVPAHIGISTAGC